MSLLILAASPANDNEPKGYVYFMYTDTGYMKIGVAKDPKARRRALQIGSAVPIWLGCAWDTERKGLNPYEVEKSLHLFFSGYKAVGEWFITPEPKDQILLLKLAWAYHAEPYLYAEWYRRTENRAAKIF